MCAVRAACGVFRGVRVLENNAEAQLGLLLHWAEHWEAQHTPGWLCPLCTLMSPGQHFILDVGILLPVPTAGVGWQGGSSHSSPRQGLSLLRGGFSHQAGAGSALCWGGDRGPLRTPSMKAEGRKGHVSKRWARERQAGLPGH